MSLPAPPAVPRERLISPQAIYILWLRALRRATRARSRAVGALLFPLLFLFFLGRGLEGASFANLPDQVSYLDYLAPGIVAMTLLFSASVAGLSVLWDRQFGFLREVMVTPVSRLSIFLGRLAAGATMGMGQAVIVYAGALAMGMQLPSPWGAALALVVALLTCVVFISFGLALSCLMKDPQGFSMIMSFVIFPIFFFSGVFYPIENLPSWLRWLAYVDPLTYSVDAMRAALVGVSSFSWPVNLAVLAAWTVVTVSGGVALFHRVEAG